ncbi:MAG: glycosyltransferase family 2 protein [Bryobacteraceae bacterium]
MSVVIPTLAADGALIECLRALQDQSFRDFETIVVDNSGQRLVCRGEAGRMGIRIIENSRNLGFGAAVNQGFRASGSPLLAVLNDDARAHPDWLARLVSAAEVHPRAGMFASQIRLAGRDQLDSAGMSIAGDGSSKQRGRLRAPAEFARLEEVLLPSGCAALYRREMVDEVGGFDDEFFLYCEDTDLGLRGRWAGWSCLYVPDAVVEHRYSHSAGRASALKAYYVERNRLFLVVKNFPFLWIARAPVCAAARYLWHTYFLFRGKGAAAEFTGSGNGGALRLALFVLRAHLAVLANLPRLWRQRRQIRSRARLSSREFAALLRHHAISAREVAAL